MRNDIPRRAGLLPPGTELLHQPAVPRWSDPTIRLGVPKTPGSGPGYPSSGAPPQRPQPQLTVERPSLALSVGNFLLCLQLFVVYSRLPELMANYLGGSGSLVRILFIVVLAAALLAGGLPRCFASRTGLLLAAFTFWLILATPFSTWRGGSVDLLINGWAKSYSFYIVIASLTVSPAQCRRALYAIGAAAVLTAVMAHFFGTEETGRLQGNVGTFANPNELAFFLVLGIPVCLLMLTRKSWLLRVAGIASAGLLSLLAFKTGSRGGVIALFVLFAFIVFGSSGLRRAILIAGICLVFVIGIAVTPKGALARYRGLFGDSSAQVESNEETDAEDESASEQAGMAAASSHERKNLLITSLVYTFQNPLFGVGPGMFGVKTSGDKSPGRLVNGWLQTHNTYTQVSSECGLPALAFFVLALFYCVRSMRRTQRALGSYGELRHLGDLANTVYLQLIVFAVSAMFISLAYSYYFPTLAGLAVAVERAYRTEMRLT